MMRKLLFMSFFLYLFPAQESISLHLPDKPWDAVWISYPDINRTHYSVLHFRKSFEIERETEKFIIHVSADNRYKLYVNGNEVCDGPARGDLENWHFETIDIAAYLNPGKNLLAAVVWNFGKYMPFAQLSHETAFLIQGNSFVESIVNTDNTWKVLSNMAYVPVKLDPPRVSSPWTEEIISTVVGPGDHVDGSLYPWDWEKNFYDDSEWKPPVVISPAIPKIAYKGQSPWHLVPRLIPPMEKKLLPGAIVRKTSGIKIDDDSFQQEKKLLIPSGTQISILLDQTFLTTAYPELITSGGKGAEIKITYAEALFDSTGYKGHRDRTENMFIYGQADEFYPDGGARRVFSTLWFRTFRYLQLDIKTADQPLTIISLRSRFVGYPFHEEAFFESDDPSLDKIWETAWRTARLCAHETYVDCPYYEQLQWIGDTRIQALISLYVSGDDRLMRGAITQINNSRLPEGLTASRYPCRQLNVIPPFSLFWIAMLHDYWMHRDDTEFVRFFLPGVHEVVEWFERHLTKNNLLGGMPWWNFVDWAPEYKWGIPPGAKDGETSVISLQYVYALRMASELAQAFGSDKDAMYYSQLAERVSRGVREHCWEPNRGLFADTPEKKQFSQHANTMAILVDLIPREEQSKVMKKVISENDLIQCTLYYRFYLLRALKKAGLGDMYLDQLAPWYQMLDNGLTTFAETPEPTRSDCHAWSASPIYEFLSTVCGIEPAVPGFRQVRIEPHPGRLKLIKTAFPHPNGKINCQLERMGRQGIAGEITLPADLYGEFLWQGKKIDLHPGKQNINLQ